VNKDLEAFELKMLLAVRLIRTMASSLFTPEPEAPNHAYWRYLLRDYPLDIAAAVFPPLVDIQEEDEGRYQIGPPSSSANTLTAICRPERGVPRLVRIISI